MSVGQGVLRIGEVHAQLRREYPDIELSKIRYYEDKGLVRPGRSRKGYRLYSDRDVACLREAIRLAQEEFVPLRVVRLRLIEQGLLDDEPFAAPTKTNAARGVAQAAVRASAPAPRSALRVVGAAESIRESAVAESSTTLDGAASLAGVASLDAPVKEWFSANELLATTGLEASAFNALQAAGVLRPESRSGDMFFRAGDVRVGALARALLERGVEVRQIAAVRRIAEREAGVIDEMSRSVAMSAGERDAGERARGDLARDVASLHAVLVTREFDR